MPQNVIRLDLDPKKVQKTIGIRIRSTSNTMDLVDRMTS